MSDLSPLTNHVPAELLFELSSDIALTFDDCNSPGTWERILDILAAEGAAATFFPLGTRVQEFPELALRTVQEGHVVGSHGWDHARFTELDDAEKQQRLEADRDQWMAVAGISPHPYFRPPYRKFDHATRVVAARCGYSKIALWSVDPKDWQCSDADKILENLTPQVRAGNIILLHAIDRTAAMLPRLLDHLFTRDLLPVALPR